MASNNVKVEQFDEWLREGSESAALVAEQILEPVEGPRAIIFPPTYAKPERTRDEDWPGYNIDSFGETNICQIDSVGSQANRMEPVFKLRKYQHLVPQVVIRTKAKDVNLLDAGHRAADAIARFAGKPQGDEDENSHTLARQLWDAFQAWQEAGNAQPLAKIAPTSILFGAWDSRGTQAKLPRVIRSVIRADNVKSCTRSAQFSPALHYVDNGLIDEALDKGTGEQNPLSQEGFKDNPAAAAHGGVRVTGDIRRNVSINLVAIRALGVPDGDDALGLRRYILGLALVAATARHDAQFNLREGCLLRIKVSAPWKVVPFEGKSTDLEIDNALALAFATEAAKDFSVQQLERPFLFEGDKANQWLKLTKDQRKAKSRKGPATEQEK